MHISREPIDYVSRLQHGYVKGTGRISSRPLLQALGLKEIIIDDPAAVAPCSRRHELRKNGKTRVSGR
jgi:hypothetical protein